ncbi:NS2 [Orungo virus]|uniref:Non-structural protein NS2 n=1 Tax=Orungo virus TaxID=40058 RepID=W5QLW8_9REOV|nr:NS2 [Orungo virus]AFX73394.1 NS2 [Orungo virus]
MAQEVKRKFTRTVCIYDPQNRTFCGRSAAMVCNSYYTIKMGRTTQCGVSPVPVPKSYVLEIPDVGSYRILDGQDSISVIVTETGVEATSERWEEWKFEGVNCVPMVVQTEIGKGLIDMEIKFSKGMGLVKPYVKNEVSRTEIPRLPGASVIDTPIRDYRQLLKDQRDERRAALDAIACDICPTLSRMLGANITDGSPQVEEVATRPTQPPAQLKLDVPNWDQPTDSDDEDEESKRVTTQSNADTEEQVTFEDCITDQYFSKTGEFAKKYPEMLAGLSAKMPSETGRFTKILTTRKAQWNNVPLFELDPNGFTYHFSKLGNSTRIFCVQRDLSYMVLPAGQGLK